MRLLLVRLSSMGDVILTTPLLVQEFRNPLVSSGMSLSGTSPDGKLVEIVEIPDHPWFLAVQFHPEFKSKPMQPHPLFVGFVGAAMARRKNERSQPQPV